MKTLRRILSILLVVIALSSIAATATAGTAPSDTGARKNELVKVAGVTVTADMTGDDLIRLFGSPKAVTVSHYGGKAYTFYNGPYKNHFFASTTSDGKIAEFFSAAEYFEINGHRCGEKVPFKDTDYNFEYLSDIKTDLCQLIACSGFNYKNYNASYEESEKRFFSDIYTYNKALAPHVIAMLNAESTLYGSGHLIVYDEEIYNCVLQLAENGNNPEYYATQKGLNGYLQFHSTGTHPNIRLLDFARNRFDCKGAPANLYSCMFYKDEVGRSRYYIGTVDKRLFKNNSSDVAFTPDEDEKVKTINKILTKSRNDWTTAPSYYDVKPQFASLPIEPGKINVQKATGAVGYLNAIRAGADLPQLTLDDDLCKKAQAKAVYVKYLLDNDYPSGHYPPKVEGISDAFYKLCAPSSAGENLYFGDALTSIFHAIDDTADKISRGHRHNLLSPTATKIGVGSSAETGLLSQGAHEMGGYEQNAKPLVSWPSIGVTPYSAIASIDRWSIRSYSDDYTFSSDTHVSTKLLNTSETKIIKNGTNDLCIYDKLISFSSNDLALAPGYVYEVTIHNIRNKAGKVYDFTYRAAVMKDSVSYDSEVEVSLDKNRAEMRQGNTLKLHGTLTVPGESPYTVTWTSSNPNVATVNDCGEVKALKPGKTVITASAEGSVAECTITVVKGCLRGDYDNNGSIEILDATYVQRILANLTESPGEDYLFAVDATGDHTFNIMDATRIQKVLANIERMDGTDYIAG